MCPRWTTGFGSKSRRACPRELLEAPPEALSGVATVTLFGEKLRSSLRSGQVSNTERFAARRCSELPCGLPHARTPTQGFVPRSIRCEQSRRGSRSLRVIAFTSSLGVATGGSRRVSSRRSHLCEQILGRSNSPTLRLAPGSPGTKLWDPTS